MSMQNITPSGDKSQVSCESPEYQKDLVSKIKIGKTYEYCGKSPRVGSRYKVLMVIRNKADLSWSVVYETLYDNPLCNVWHRELTQFLEKFKLVQE